MITGDSGRRASRMNLRVGQGIYEMAESAVRRPEPWPRADVDHLPEALHRRRQQVLSVELLKMGDQLLAAPFRQSLER